MPIIIKNGDGSAECPKRVDFPNEEALEELLEKSPDLLRGDNEPETAFVARQVLLRETGKMDLLMVDAEGLPIAVEVKLARNGESRRQVLAQAIDYAASLTSLTVDELDRLCGGALEQALRRLSGDDQTSFEKIWDAAGYKPTLRASAHHCGA